MNKNLIKIAASLGSLAVITAVVLALSAVSIDVIVGYGAVLALLVGVATEYRLNRRTVLGR